jgi:hypothetical protein
MIADANVVAVACAMGSMHANDVMPQQAMR